MPDYSKIFDQCNSKMNLANKDLKATNPAIQRPDFTLLYYIYNFVILSTISFI